MEVKPGLYAITVVVAVLIIVGLFTIPTSKRLVVEAAPPAGCGPAPKPTGTPTEKCIEPASPTCTVDVLCGVSPHQFHRQAKCYDYYTPLGHFCYRRCEASTVACSH